VSAFVVAGRSWPTAEVRQGEYRGAGMRAEATGRAIRGIISATDPKQTLMNIVGCPFWQGAPLVLGNGDPLAQVTKLFLETAIMFCIQD
jgi:hypothetical protein